MKLFSILHRTLTKMSNSIIRDRGDFSRKYKLAMWISNRMYPNIKDPFHGEMDRTLEPEELNYFKNMDTRVLLYNIIYILEKITIGIIIFILGRLSIKVF